MNTCKDCQFCKDPGEFATCGAPQNNKMLPTGFNNRRYTYCGTHRSEGWLACRVIGICGREGRWFQPKGSA